MGEYNYNKSTYWIENEEKEEKEEDINEKNNASKIDIYRLGLIIYEMFGGINPLKRSSSEEIRTGLKDALFDFEHLKLSENAKDFVQNCLKKKPEDRISFKEALEHKWFRELGCRETLSDVSQSEVVSMISNIIKFKNLSALQKGLVKFFVVNHFIDIKSFPPVINFFFRLDIDSNGTVSKEEYFAELKYMFEEDYEKYENDINEAFDFLSEKGKKETISLHDFITPAIDKAGIITNEIVIQKAFDFFDVNKDGDIDIEEIKKGLGDKGKDLTQEEIDRILGKDAAYGKVTFESFKKLIKGIFK